jgi:hypothetical protein
MNHTDPRTWPSLTGLYCYLMECLDSEISGVAYEFAAEERRRANLGIPRVYDDEAAL